ncbi:hypothetical protein BCR44DRAFT_1423067 [Catenaria anguillulae PL171]|uniref:Uncharacterized protein n=1 Tax=Catenaria anguillulae PL171 TaxID=765915 RepID=A0A1Y2I671_9FUNG|nr:hypothetical protein BCR44DRAFT_1423067 [Catenaria anguillulae PL171]
MHLPESLHVLLRMVLDNDLTTPVPMTLLPTHVPPASSTGYLPPSLACDFPPRPRLPPPTTTCPPVSAADVDGFCMEPQMPTFGQRMEASLVHAVTFCNGGPSSSINASASSPTFTSNFPGQLSIWSSSNFNRPKTRSAPAPAGLSVVGRDALILRYIDLDPNEPVLQEEASDTDDDDGDCNNEHQQEDRECAASEYHDQGGSALAAFVGSLTYCLHIPLDRSTHHRSPHLAGASPRFSTATVDTELDGDEWIEPPVSGQDMLILDLAAPPTFSVHSVCTLSRYYSPPSSARRWIFVGEQDEFTSLISRIPSRVPLVYTSTLPSPLSFTPGPVRAWWSWSDLVALTNRTAAPMAHLCERCSLVPSPTAPTSNTTTTLASHARLHATNSSTPGSVPRPPPPPISSPPPHSPLRPRSSSASTCDCCGGDLSTADTSFNMTETETDVATVDSATDVSDDEQVDTNAQHQRGPRPLLIPSHQHQHHAHQAHPRPGRPEPNPPEAPVFDDVDAPAVTLHALPSPTIVRQVIEDSGLPYRVILPESSPPTLVSTCVTPEDIGPAPLITMAVSDALAELKADLGMSADVRARDRLEENLIARRQILNLLYLVRIGNLAAHGGVTGVASAPVSTIGPTENAKAQDIPASGAPRRPSISAAAFSRRMSASLANIAARGRRRSSVTSEAPTVLDTPTIARNESWQAQPQAQKTLAAPESRRFYSLCRGCDVSSEVVWHCSLCRTCVSIDHHHCPACNQCVYVPGPSSLPQFRPVPATSSSSEDETMVQTHPQSSQAPARVTEGDARPSRISFAPDPPRDSAATSTVDARRRLASLRTGLRASVHYHHCPTCAHTSDQEGILLKAPVDTVHAQVWADLHWVQWVLEQVPPDMVDDAVATAQSVVSSLVYLAIGQVAPVFGLADLARGSMLSTVPEGWKIEEGAWSDDTDCDDRDDVGDQDQGSSGKSSYSFAQASPAGASAKHGPPPLLTINTGNLLPPAHAFGSISAPPSASVVTPTSSPHPAPISLIKDPATGVLRRNHMHHSSSSFASPPIVGAGGSLPSTPVRGVLPKVLSTEDLTVIQGSGSSSGSTAHVTTAAGDAAGGANGLAGSRKSWEPVHLRPGVIAYPTTTTTRAGAGNANVNGAPGTR